MLVARYPCKGERGEVEQDSRLPSEAAWSHPDLCQPSRREAPGSDSSLCGQSSWGTGEAQPRTREGSPLLGLMRQVCREVCR